MTNKPSKNQAKVPVEKTGSNSLKVSSRTPASKLSAKVVVPAKKPVAKAPVKVAVPAKKPVAKALAKAAAPAKKPVAKAPAKAAAPAKKPAAKAPVKAAAPAKKPAAKAPVKAAAPAKKPAAKAPVKAAAPVKKPAVVAPVKVVTPVKPVLSKPAPVIPAEVPKPVKPVVRNIDKNITEILSDLSWAKKLDAQKKRYLDLLLDSLNKMNAQFRDLSANSLEQGGFSTDDVGDMGNIQYTQDMNLRLMQEEQESRTMICQAIERLYTGSYGTCVDCGCKISEKRLEARPYAIYCIDCRERVEKETAARSGFSYRMR